MSKDTIFWLALAGVAYYLYSNAAPSPLFTTCKYPDGSTINVPIGNSCPIDPAHGGQSYPCVSPGAGVPPGPWASC